MDIGVRDERFQIMRGAGSLTLLAQLESQAGEASLFPTWSSSTGLLQAHGSGANNEEVSVFDISGVQTLTINYSIGSRAGAGVAGASFAIGVPIPEPCSAMLAAVGLLSVAARRARWLAA